MTMNTGPAKTGPAGSLAMAMMVEPNLTCSLVSTLTVIQLSESQSTCNASKNSCATHGDLKSILIIVSIHNSGTFCTHAAVMVHPETTSSPEKQNRRDNQSKGPENWRITVWQECMSNTTNQLEG